MYFYSWNLSLLKSLTIAFTLTLGFSPVSADVIRVAVASNFTHAIKQLANDFEDKTDHKVVIIIGSSGKHYAQIKNGAPFDVFFSADSKRPELLDEEGISLSGSRFTYALGKLVLWSPKKAFVDTEGKILALKSFNHLALANPKLAPYGRAAKEVLQKLKLWETLGAKAVRGENIGQAFRFVKSQAADLGFVAYSQVIQNIKGNQGSYWDVPENLYSPIKQQAVLIKDNDVARAFLTFIKSKESQQKIRDFGYGTAL